jgi:hypothetical protein
MPAWKQFDRPADFNSHLLMKQNHWARFCAVHAEFTPGRTKGIDYMFAGETRRLKKSVVAPSSSEMPNSK